MDTKVEVGTLIQMGHFILETAKVETAICNFLGNVGNVEMVAEASAVGKVKMIQCLGAEAAATLERVRKQTECEPRKVEVESKLGATW